MRRALAVFVRNPIALQADNHDDRFMGTDPCKRQPLTAARKIKVCSACRSETESARIALCPFERLRRRLRGISRFQWRNLPNEDGVNCAFPPLPDSREDWRILLDLAGKLDLPLHWRGPEQIFLGLAEAQAPFKGLSYETIGMQGINVGQVDDLPSRVAS